MNISTLAKILGVSISELREIGTRHGLHGFGGRNTRIPYTSALEVTKILRPDKVAKLQNDDRIYLPAALTVAEFAESIDKPPGLVVKTLVMNGVMATLNEKIDYDTAFLVASELGVEVFPDENAVEADQFVTVSAHDSLTKTFSLDQDDQSGRIVTRPPVVTVMGHVDHGKTTLLDTIRHTNVVAQEAGAITQHISSYQITYKEKKITFVDTPGHEAFTAMRARGTQLADFIILMVSAVEGPKPQTVEVIERAKLAKTPVIVAVNKIDLPGADVERVKTEVAAFGLVPEEWGGDTPYIPISAKNNQNIDKLLDTVLLFAEVAELKGRVECPGQAVVIESYLDPKLGVVVNALITAGHIKIGDVIACDTQTGKIRKLINSEGVTLERADITEPVQILGLPAVALIGELIKVFPSMKLAQQYADEMVVRSQSSRRTTHTGRISEEGEINLVLVADVSGSLEALKESILKIPQEHAKIAIKRTSIGSVTESDIEFASLTGSTILAFHTTIHPQASKMLKNTKVNMVKSDIIYEILNWVEEEELKHVKHEIRIEVLGKAKVLKLFKADKPGIQVFGGEVLDGKILANKRLRVMRAGQEVGRLEIVELQRDRVKAAEINVSQQFGVSVTGKVKVMEDDIVESFDEIVVR